MTESGGRMVSKKLLYEVQPASRYRQVCALAWGEWRLLLRNRTALLSAVLLPPGLVFVLSRVSGVSGGGLLMLTPALILSTALVFVVYYTLVTAIVARRESYVLQRLRTGEAGGATALVGLALPFALIAVAQTGVGVLASWAILRSNPPGGWLVMVWAVALGVTVWSLLGVACAGITRSVEHAQITTLPLITVSVLLSGISLPLSMTPPWVQEAALWTPLNPIVELMRLGMSAGVGDQGGALTIARPTLVIIMWGLVAVLAIRRYMRWEPRG